MYLLDIPEETSDMIIQLHQRDRACYGEREYVDVGLTVLSLSKDGSTYKMVPGDSTGCQLNRQVTLELGTLKPGRYVIVPVSSGCKYRHEADAIKRGRRSSGSSSGSSSDSGTALSAPPKLRLTTQRIDAGDNLSDLDWATTLAAATRAKKQYALMKATSATDTTTATTATTATDSAQSPSSPSSSATASSATQQRYVSQHQLTPKALAAFSEIFYRLDEDMDQVLNKEELDSFMLMSEGTMMHDKVYS